jgi:signal peptide peptidase SppA
MKTYPHLFAKLFCSPLALRSVERQNFEQHLLHHMGMLGTAPPMMVMSAEPTTPQAADRSQMPRRTARVFQQVGDVAVIRIEGVIDKRISEFDMDCYGGCDLSDVDNALAIAASDKGISRVVLDIHSPGGSVVGVAETSARIAMMRETDKEVHAFVNAMACSAGYWLASQADVIAAAPSAIVGSIGVYMAILDASRAMEMEGLSMQMIKAGKHKDTGSPYRPLNNEEKARLQKDVNLLHDRFRSAVTELRDVDTEAMEGQWMTGADGYEANLVDVLTGATLDEYVSGLLLS